MSLEQAADEYIRDIPPTWKVAVEAFLSRDCVPLGHPDRFMLENARIDLRDGAMLRDTTIYGYMDVIRKIPMPTPAVFMDTLAATKLYNHSSFHPYQDLRSWSLGKVTILGDKGHVFWPVHHGAIAHWSLVHVNITDKTVVGYDSFWKLGGNHTIEMRNRIFDYWTATMVSGIDEKADWKKCAQTWSEDGVQIQGSGTNDCGIIVCLLMNNLRAGYIPSVPTDRKLKQDTMKYVGQRMRQRIAAELLAGCFDLFLNPVPSWIQGCSRTT